MIRYTDLHIEMSGQELVVMLEKVREEEKHRKRDTKSERKKLVIIRNGELGLGVTWRGPWAHNWGPTRVTKARFTHGWRWILLKVRGSHFLSLNLPRLFPQQSCHLRKLFIPSQHSFFFFSTNK